MLEQDYEQDFGNDVENEEQHQQEENDLEGEGNEIASEEHSGSTIEDVEGEEEEVESKVEETKKKPKGRPPGKTRINQLVREKYQLAEEANRLREEVEQLKRMTEFSTQAAMNSYDDSINLRLEKAKQLKAEAIESGDVQSQINADVELSSAINEFHRINEWKAQQQYQQQYQSNDEQHYNRQDPQMSHQLVTELKKWTERNPWFDINSEHYDEEKAELANEISIELNNKLARSGYGYQIGTKDYFGAIEEVMEKHLEDSQESENNYRRPLSMKPSRSVVSPVSRGGSQMNGGRRQIVLTNDEKDMARRIGIDEKEFIKYKVSTRQVDRERGRG